MSSLCLCKVCVLGKLCLGQADVPVMSGWPGACSLATEQGGEYISQMQHPPFYEVFFSDETIKSWAGDLTFELHELGTVNLPSGRVVVCDPLAAPEGKPLGFAAPPGAYPVRLAVAHVDGDERVACAQVEFTQHVPRDWYIALLDDQDPDEVSEWEMGVPVDSATAAFMSVEAAEIWVRRLELGTGFSDAVCDRLEASYVDTRQWATIDVDPERSLNAVLFSTGFGDGLYPCFLGLSENGSPCCLIVDFGLLETEDADQ